MRRDLAERMLDAEVAIARAENRTFRDVIILREGTDVLVSFTEGRDGRPGLFRLDCAHFDTEPPGVGMLDPESRDELLIERWTTGVPHSVHPKTGKPFVCAQGIAEYHSHPSHINDSWDRYRNTFRLAQTVRLLLNKAGVPR